MCFLPHAQKGMHQMLVSIQDNRNSHLLLVGMQNGTATLEDSWAVSYKTKHILTTPSSNHSPWYLSKGFGNFRPHKNLHTDVYSSSIHKCQNLEATKVNG